MIPREFWASYQRYRAQRPAIRPRPARPPETPNSNNYFCAVNRHRRPYEDIASRLVDDVRQQVVHQPRRLRVCRDRDRVLGHRGAIRLQKEDIDTRIDGGGIHHDEFCHCRGVLKNFGVDRPAQGIRLKRNCGHGRSLVQNKLAIQRHIPRFDTQPAIDRQGNDEGPRISLVFFEIDPFGGMTNVLATGPCSDGSTAPPVGPIRLIVTDTGELFGFVKTSFESKPFPLRKCGATRSAAG